MCRCKSHDIFSSQIFFLFQVWLFLVYFEARRVRCVNDNALTIIIWNVHVQKYKVRQINGVVSKVAQANQQAYSQENVLVLFPHKMFNERLPTIVQYTSQSDPSRTTIISLSYSYRAKWILNIFLNFRQFK